MTKTHEVRLTQCSNKDRLNFYHCVADTVLGMSDHAHHKCIVEIKIH